ncbi:microfibril-associated glycoprotein 4-like [Aplochiton taeniatus]
MMIWWALALALPLLVDCDTDPRVVLESCGHHYNAGSTASRRYLIQPQGFNNSFAVFCDMEPAEAEANPSRKSSQVWTVFLRRSDGSLNFYRGWDDYKSGFGDPDTEIWRGLDYLAEMTKAPCEVNVKIADFKGTTGQATYKSFKVYGEEDNYKLEVSGFVDGGAGDALSPHSGSQFTTHDKDNDGNPKHNCAKLTAGAFWFPSSDQCVTANPTGVYMWGDYENEEAIGVVWSPFKPLKYSLKELSMKIRCGS